MTRSRDDSTELSNRVDHHGDRTRSESEVGSSHLHPATRDRAEPESEHHNAGIVRRLSGLVMPHEDETISLDTVTVASHGKPRLTSLIRRASVSNIDEVVRIAKSSKRPHLVALARMQGSVLSLVMVDIIVWLLLYYTLSMWYRYSRPSPFFVHLVRFAREVDQGYPAVEFIVGFFVGLVASAWLHSIRCRPAPALEQFAQAVRVLLRPGALSQDIMRYAAQTSALALQLTSSRVRRLLPPASDALVRMNLQTTAERRCVEQAAVQTRSVPWWLPLAWLEQALSAHDASKHGRQREAWKEARDSLLDMTGALRESLRSLIEEQLIGPPRAL
ncbi:MAG: hypothetical protein MHM6MM_004245 [Cercozoa sp. M6MM]